jgi:hypothetical protein
MSTTSRVAGAVAAGYVLGRFKKLRMAVLVGSAMSSPKFRDAAAEMIQNRIPGGAIVGGLTREVGGKLVGVGKTAATSLVASRIDALSQNLAERSENLRKGAPDGKAPKPGAEESAEDREAEEPEDEFQDQEDEEADQPEDEYEEQEDEEADQPEDEYEEQDDEEADQPEDEYEEQDDEEADQPEDQDAQADEEADQPEDEYEEQDDEEADQPEDEYEEQDDEEADQPEDQDAQADETSHDEEPEEPVTRSPRRRRSASPAGRRRG